MFTVLSILGTRPEAIKMAPVIAELRRHPHEIRSVVCSAGQHRQMLDQVLDLFHIVPDVELHVMTDGPDALAAHANCSWPWIR
jgi:UDP-N-acetylglucosamine 2-epimerase (non-hydrolysing)